MIRKLIYGSFIFVIACQSLESPDKPKNFIPEEKMVEILTDIAFVKAAKSSYKKVFDKEKINPETYILQKHNIDSTVFAQNNKWYTNQIEEYQEIFTKVKNNLGDAKSKFEKLKKVEDSIKKIQDSIDKSKGIEKGKKLLNSDELFLKEENASEYILNKKPKKNTILKKFPLKNLKKSQ